ncbi:MAG: sporulation protein YqfD [Clostridia bacterium]|nr:sporulation protein YqfD [Clostridia bacterium]
MAEKVGRWLSGWVRVEARGARLAELVSAVARAGHPVFAARAAPDAWTFSAPRGALPAIEAEALRLGLSVRVVGRGGLPELARRLARHPSLLAFGLGLALLLWLASSFVWIVAVEGASEVPAPAILAAARDLGLAPGAFRPSLDRDRVARLLPVLIPRLSWATVSLRGTRAVIRVAEEAEPPPELLPASRPADLVARRDGLVTDVLALAGQPAVRPGDIVAKGQVLVRGRVEAVPRGYDPADPRAPRMTMDVRARGEVRARVWYHRYVEVPARARAATPAQGRGFTRYRLDVFGRSLILWGRREPPFPFVVSERAWPSPTSPVALVREDVRAEAPPAREVSPDEALAAARRTAVAEVAGGLGRGARVVRATAELVVRTADVYGVAVLVETEEDIAETREFAPSASR